MTLRAAIYCRLSEEDRDKLHPGDDSLSIRNQKDMLLRYAHDQGWSVQDIYSDDDYAGSDRRRPAFNRLLQDAQQRRFDVILCKSQSRFTREMELVEKYIHGLLPQWGVRFVSIADGADTASPANKKARQINGLVNEWYLEDMSENIRSALTSRRLQGWHIGSSALYGYRKDPAQKGHLLIDDRAAAVVREIFTRFAGGMGKTAIARMLNARGIPNPTAYKRHLGLHCGGENSGLWRYSTIASMLQNAMYCGHMVQGRYGSVSCKRRENRPRPRDSWYVVENTHDAIINPVLWDRVQARIGERTRPFAAGSIGLFAGKARCALCGCVMRSHQTRQRRYLMCSRRHVSKTACAGAFIAVERLEAMVLAQLRRLTSLHADPAALARQAALHISDPQRSGLTKELTHLRRQDTQLTQALRQLYLDKANHVLTEDEHGALARDFLQEQNLCRQRIADAEARLASLPLPASPEELTHRCMALPCLTRTMVEAFIDRIEVGQRIPGTRAVPVTIHWRF